MSGLIALLQDELGLSVTLADTDKDLDQVVGWDSAHMVEFLVLLERETGLSYSLPDLLAARTIREIYETVAAS